MIILIIMGAAIGGLIGYMFGKILELERSNNMSQHKPTKTKKSGNGTKVKGK